MISLNKESSLLWRSPQTGYPHSPTNSKLRVCLDPRDVNKAIKRDHYKTPTVEEITHLLEGSKKFTKVNGTSSYLFIVPDYELPLLTTFNTPWGRYRFIHLPWGLTCAQDIFQQMMDQILEHCEGVIGIADDVVIYGKDDEDHDQKLHRFMQVAISTWTCIQQREMLGQEGLSYILWYCL